MKEAIGQHNLLAIELYNWHVYVDIERLKQLWCSIVNVEAIEMQIFWV